MKRQILFNSNGLAIWHDFQIIKYILKIKSDRMSAS